MTDFGFWRPPVSTFGMRRLAKNTGEPVANSWLYFKSGSDPLGEASYFTNQNPMMNYPFSTPTNIFRARAEFECGLFYTSPVPSPGKYIFCYTQSGYTHSTYSDPLLFGGGARFSNGAYGGAFDNRFPNYGSERPYEVTFGGGFSGNPVSSAPFNEKFAADRVVVECLCPNYQDRYLEAKMVAYRESQGTKYVQNQSYWYALPFNIYNKLDGLYKLDGIAPFNGFYSYSNTTSFTKDVIIKSIKITDNATGETLIDLIVNTDLGAGFYDKITKIFYPLPAAYRPYIVQLDDQFNLL